MTAPGAPASLGDGRWLVPGNRWDLVDGLPPRPAAVSVIIAYYNQPQQVSLALAALEAQDYPHDLFEVIIADDGSETPPEPPSVSFPCRVVRQPDLGFRAAAARNLGARAAHGEVLCFLDADMVPVPEYLARISRLPALVPDALVVGRRRHADLAAWTAEHLDRWWSGQIAPRELPEPRWLSDAYSRTDNLLRHDHRSYRHIISSVMACGRELFEYAGGFDESFTAYGGEDWEFAHRAMVCGAVLQHEPQAVAWHDGPDWALRPVSERAAAKNEEALRLARLVPDLDARVPGLRYEVPHVAVEISADSHGAGSFFHAIAGFLRSDCEIWVHGESAPRLLAALPPTESRIHAGRTPEHILRRSPYFVRLRGRASITHTGLHELIRACSRPGVCRSRAVLPAAEIICFAAWARNRARRWAHLFPLTDEELPTASATSTADLSPAQIGLTPVERDQNIS